MYVSETFSEESWYWSKSNFISTQRTLKYDYSDSISYMIFGEVLMRSYLLLRLTLFFAFISIVNAIVIRMTVKCSILALMWYTKIEEQCLRNNTRVIAARTRFVYSMVGSPGA